MGKRVLITGGAGFIGSHLADRLLLEGYAIRVLDSLCPQVHGAYMKRPPYLDSRVELLAGDIQDPVAVERALDGVDAVVHLAGRVGTAQSMYRLTDYTDSNVSGTAVLLQALIEHPVERLIIGSSMSIYGEGLYEDLAGQPHTAQRTTRQLRAGNWEPRDGNGYTLRPLPTPETHPPNLASVYALSKFHQEHMCLMAGRTYGIPTVSLRFANVYGERQGLSNPHGGVLAAFAVRLLNGNPPLVFEDGGQRRDFVHVRDVAEACWLALNAPDIDGEIFNIGGGQPVSVAEIATRIATALDLSDEPAVLGKHRIGDVRHCYPDISKAAQRLGYRPQVSLEHGIERLVGWMGDQEAEDRSAEASEELVMRGLTV